ncbi:hypothetical protein Landi51_06572 [Colletotrichum acutatum]
MASRLIPPSLISLPCSAAAPPQREGNDVTRLGQSFQVPAQVNRTSPPEHRPDRPHRTWSTPSPNPITSTTTTKHNITSTQADRASPPSHSHTPRPIPIGSPSIPPADRASILPL